MKPRDPERNWRSAFPEASLPVSELAYPALAAALKPVACKADQAIVAVQIFKAAWKRVANDFRVQKRGSSFLFMCHR